MSSPVSPDREQVMAPGNKAWFSGLRSVDTCVNRLRHPFEPGIVQISFPFLSWLSGNLYR